MAVTVYISSSQETRFYLIADTSTANVMFPVLEKKCSSTLAGLTEPYLAGDPHQPQPEEVVQYYRASSAALALEGYNNTAQLSDDTSLPDTPLPTNIDTDFLTCLNETIGAAIPLVDAANPTVWNFGVTGSAYTMSCFWLLYYVLSVMF